MIRSWEDWHAEEHELEELELEPIGRWTLRELGAVAAAVVLLVIVCVVLPTLHGF